MMIFRSVRNADGTIVDFEWLYCNPSASHLVGRKAEYLLGKRLLVEFPGNRSAGLFDLYVEVVEGGQPHAHEFSYCYDGLDKWFRATSIKQGDGFYVAFSDFTVRRRAEEQAARLAAIVRSSDHALFSTTNDGIVETWNKGAERLFGYSSAEMVGKPILLTVPEHYRAEHEEAALRVVERGGVDSFQTVRVTKEGKLVDVSIMLSPITDLDGRMVGTAVIARDVSQQVKLQERLVLADRMASLGTLAAGMAHEINNPLTCISGNLEVLVEELREIGGGSPSGRLKELKGMVFDARGGAERIRTIVRGLMTFSHGDEERRAVVEVTPILDLSVAMAFYELRKRARVVKDYGQAPRVFADDARLGQVFINLLVNAAHAIGEGGAPDGDEIHVSTSTDDQGRAVVEIRDTGSGIPLALLGRLFDPFFTTKPVGIGAGLGLSICRNIVTSLGGELTARNNDGPGATFRVAIPAASSLRDRRAGVPVDGVKASSRATVLIVDDEPDVGRALGRVLRDHDVTSVTRAKEALALILSGKRFDVILCDLMMPEMSGMDLYSELERRDPSAAQNVVFITGGVCTSKAGVFLDGVTNLRIDKPFDVKGVRALVQKLATK
jgi:PAS domain S-box-containing protein